MLPRSATKTFLLIAALAGALVPASAGLCAPGRPHCPMPAAACCCPAGATAMQSASCCRKRGTLATEPESAEYRVDPPAPVVFDPPLADEALETECNLLVATDRQGSATQSSIPLYKLFSVLLI